MKRIILAVAMCTLMTVNTKAQDRTGKVAKTNAKKDQKTRSYTSNKNKLNPQPLPPAPPPDPGGIKKGKSGSAKTILNKGH